MTATVDGRAGRSAAPLPVGSATVPATLSPSRASDFMTCPLLYRFRVVDRLPEEPTVTAVRGTVVHAVLERLFDLPPHGRTLDAATDLLPAAWASTVAADGELRSVVGADVDAAAAQWLDGAAALLNTYFTLEDPARFTPAEREVRLEVDLPSGLRLRGYVDRLDVAADGAVRVVDYKTGRAPRDGFEQKALFQIRFYALAWWRLHDVIPRMLQLLYLGSGEVIRYQPDVADLLATERKLLALWTAIERAHRTGDWRPHPSRLCDWCSHQALCPSFGGTPPPLPQRELHTDDVAVLPADVADA